MKFGVLKPGAKIVNGVQRLNSRGPLNSAQGTRAQETERRITKRDKDVARLGSELFRETRATQQLFH